MTIDLKLKPVKIPGFVERFGLSDWDGINRIETDPTEDSPVNAPVDTVADPVVPVVESVDDGLEKLRSALEKERAANREKEKALKRYKSLESSLGDLDPEELARLRANAERLQKLEDEKAQLKAEIESQFERDKQEALEAERKQSRQYQQQLESLKLETACREAYLSAGGRPEGFTDFYAIASREIVKDPKGNYRIQRGGETLYLNNESWLDDDDPRKGKPYSVADLMQMSLRDPVRGSFFKPRNQSSGSGVSGGGFAAGSEKPKNPQEMRAWARQQRKSGF